MITDILNAEINLYFKHMQILTYLDQHDKMIFFRSIEILLQQALLQQRHEQSDN